MSALRHWMMHLTTFSDNILNEYRMLMHSSKRAGLTLPSLAATVLITWQSSWICEMQDSRAMMDRMVDWIGACSYWRSSISLAMMGEY